MKVGGSIPVNRAADHGTWRTSRREHASTTSTREEIHMVQVSIVGPGQGETILLGPAAQAGVVGASLPG
jgi:hypothetical protein